MEKVSPVSTQNLAYLGDAVFELAVRARLTADGSKPVSVLNRAAKAYVSAGAQAAMYQKIYPLLTEEEQSVMKRGRNLNTASRAKHANLTDYRHATGLEVLFGYLYLQNQPERLEEVFNLCVGDNHGQS